MDTSLIDPLKLAAYGVKKPFAPKDTGVRDYPTDCKGGVDEWGAILKHRDEVSPQASRRSATPSKNAAAWRRPGKSATTTKSS